IQEFNAPVVEESEMDIDPLLQLVVKKPQKQYRKPKFTYGEVLVEWRYKKKIEEDGTICRYLNLVERCYCSCSPSSRKRNSLITIISTNGPGKLCRALNIDISLNHTDLTTSDLIYLENAPEITLEQIVSTRLVLIW
ncbi:18204_t:CDS:2, partial [Gigaspora rosea]